jgi:hypothetical protein
MRNAHMKLTKYAVGVVLATLWGGAQAAGIFNVSAHYGQKFLNQVDWEPTETQSEIGLGLTFTEPGWPVEMVWNFLHSSDSGTDSGNPNAALKVSADTTELSYGARKNLTEGAVKVFAEGGLVSISATSKGIDTVTGDSVTISDSALGLWLGAGVDVMLGNAVSVGGLVRLSKADASDSALGGTHFGLYAAYHFP